MKKNNYDLYERGQEISGITFQQHQNQVIESISATMQALGLDPTTPTRLFGLAASEVGSDHTVTAGAIFVNGEIFYVDGFTGNDGGGTEVPYLRPLNVPVGDDVSFVDGTILGVHMDHKYEVTLGSTGATGEFMLSTAASFPDQLEALLGTEAYTDTQIAALVAGETELDTFAKLSDAINGLKTGGVTNMQTGASLDQGEIALPNVIQTVTTSGKYIIFNSAEARIPMEELTVPASGKRVIKLFTNFISIKDGSDRYFTASLVYRIGGGAWVPVRSKRLLAFGNSETVFMMGHIELTSQPVQYLEFALHVVPEGGSIRMSGDDHIEFDAMY